MTFILQIAAGLLLAYLILCFGGLIIGLFLAILSRGPSRHSGEEALRRLGY